MHPRAILAALRAVPLALACAAAPAADIWLLAGPGFGPLRRPPRQFYGSLELDLWPVRRHFGVWASMDNSPGGRWVGLGPLVGTTVGRGIHLGFGTGPGWYPDRGRFDLGSHLEFRSTVYLTVPLKSGWEAGLTLSHYSNAGTASHNPGAETVRVVLVIPLR